MKKYFRITFFLSAFFLLVLGKNLKGSDEGGRALAPGFTIKTPTGNLTAVPSNSPILSAQNPIVPTTAPALGGKYKDGTYAGKVTDAYYGLMQVQVIIARGKINDIIFLQYPNDNRTSRRINSEALPILKSEAIQAQSSQVDIVSGASDSSPAFIESLAFALSKAI